MLMIPKKQSIKIGIFLVVLVSFGITACSSRYHIAHEPLDYVENKKEGSILVKQFVDKREVTEHIGNKRNGLGMIISNASTEEGVKLDVLLTTYFAESLKEAGYTVFIENPDFDIKNSQVNFDAIVEGEILHFWLDAYMAIWQYITVKIRVLNPTDQRVMWEKDIEANTTNAFWYGGSSEYEKIISQSLTSALNKAAKEFASDDFHKSLKK